MIINSLLDTDWYKITMGQAAFFFFPDMQVKYKFILRDDVKFPDGFEDRLWKEIHNLATLKLTPEEYKWLAGNPNIYTHYLNWFSNYQFKPSEINTTFENNRLGITIEGPWIRSVYWEVPLLAIISELYFEMTGQVAEDSDVFLKTLVKSDQLTEMPFVEFGTRRRLSFNAQNRVVGALHCSNGKTNFIGTSNPFFAKEYGIWIIGTYAHEAIMAMQTIKAPIDCDQVWLRYWKTMYGKMLNVALSDTLTTVHFLKSVDDTMFRLLDGIRQDSGDPVEIACKIMDKWESLGIDPKTKNIVFSDNLNPDKARVIWDIFKNKTMPIFGIGTNLTNDFGFKPLNMVIKMVEADGVPVVKLSDDPMKHTGDSVVVENMKQVIES